MRISDWSSDVCSSDLLGAGAVQLPDPAPEQPCARPDLAAGDGRRRRAVQGGLAQLARHHPALWRHRAASPARPVQLGAARRSEEHTSELQSLMRISYAVFCLKKKIQDNSRIYLDTGVQF